MLENVPKKTDNKQNLTIKLKNIKFPKTYSELLQWVCYLWAGTICFPDLQGTFYGVFVFLLWGVFRGHIGLSFKSNTNTSFWKSKKTPFYFLLAYLLWMTSTIFWSDDIREYFRQFEKLIPLYLLAFIGFMDGVKKHIDFNKILNAFLWGVLVAVAYMVIRMGVDMFVGDTIGRIKTAGIMSLDLLTSINHRTYIGATLLMAIPLLMMNIKSQSRWQQVSTIVFVLFIDLLCIMSSARILMGLSVLVTLYACYYVWGKQVKWWIQLVVFSVVLSGSLVLVLQNQRIQSKIAQIQQGADIEDLESRTYLWKCATELIKEKPLCGYGMGDAKDALLGKYKEYDYKLASVRQFNAHNQYLQIMLYGGAVGLGLLMLFFITLIVQSKQLQPLGITFILVFGIIMMVESALVRNIGVMPMILFVVMMVQSIIYSDSRKSIISIISLYLFFLLIIGLIIGIAYPIKNTNPNTFANGEFDVVRYKDLPNVQGLPEATSAMFFDLHEFKYLNRIGGNSWGYYVFHEQPESSEYLKNVIFSLWCYVPNESTISSAKIFVHDSKNGYSEQYDMTKKGTWQKVSIQVDETNLKKARFYNMAVVNSNIIKETDYAYFALPVISVNNKNVIY